ncbi:DUF302 domain-containing protein [Rhodococcus sp. 077-4]|uniref:DUF302 domain-containing protein n=1 Tax=Rhodococcus sp. 077-4 TaxID=2789271 RepID=UPI0039F51E9A
MTGNTRIRRTPHTMTRVEIATGIPIDEFLIALERAVPEADLSALQGLVTAGGTWQDMVRAVDGMAPHGLLRYAKVDATDAMRLAGHSTTTVEYLIGNHVIAESMFRHDPKAMLYAPLRALVFADAEGSAVFAIVQPSTVFAGLGIAEVTRVGHQLDEKVEALLKAVGVEAEAIFGTDRT